MGGVESVDLTLVYDPAILTVTGVNLGSGLPANSAMVADFVTQGRVTIGVALPTAPAGGAATLVTLAVEVKSTALYRDKELLHFTSVELNEGALAATPDDGVHVVAYYGDTTGNGGYSSLDGQRVLRVAVGLDGGFAVFPLVDPVIIGDVTGNGAISSLDATRILQEVVGQDRAEIPARPTPVPALTFAGADPSVRMGATVSATPGEVVTVPVNVVDTAAGIQRVDLEIHYDSGVLEVDLGTGVRAGALVAGGALTYEVNAAAGTITVALTTPAPMTGGTGSLVEVDYRVRADATPGTTVLDLVRVSLNEDALAVGPAVPQPGPDATDGEIHVVETGSTSVAASGDSARSSSTQLASDSATVSPTGARAIDVRRRPDRVVGAPD